MQPQPLKVMVAVGARPNYMKAAPLIRALTDPSTAMETGRPPIELTVTHTGQHYEDGLSRTLFEELSLPAADVNLNVGSGPHGRQTGLILQRFEPVLEERWPDVLVVAGDVNSTLACALVAAKSWRRLPGGGWKRPRIAHIEAGLRSFDPTMPEETNRRLTDALSDDLLIHSPEARGNLLREGVREDDILEVGNLMIDTLDRLLPLARRSDIFVRLGLRLGGAPEEGKPYALLTLHRPSNVDDPEIFKRLLRGAARISPDLEIIFPMHPRVRKAAPKILEALHRERAGPLAPIRLIEPLGYLDFIALMDRAALVLTDSGGVQEETTALGVPCLTLRENTERPVTVTMGTNTLAGIEEERIVQEGRRSLSGDSMPFSRPPLWDGHAGERAAHLLVQRALQGAPVRNGAEGGRGEGGGDFRGGTVRPAGLTCVSRPSKRRIAKASPRGRPSARGKGRPGGNDLAGRSTGAPGQSGGSGFQFLGHDGHFRPISPPARDSIRHRTPSSNVTSGENPRSRNARLPWIE